MPGERRFRLGRGLDIPLAGEATGSPAPGPAVERVAVVLADYVGTNVRLAVEPSQRVAVGEVLFADRQSPDIRWTAPGTGIIEAINRGDRRRLISVVIRLDDDSDTVPLKDSPAIPAQPDRESVIRLMTETGLWVALRARPYDRIPLPNTTPAAILVTAMDTEPLSPDPGPTIDANADAFRAGVAALASLTDGPLYVCAAPGDTPPLPTQGADRVTVAYFSGPHPAGLPGTHGHYLMPPRPDRPVWHIGYQDVIALGRAMTEGVLSMRRIVALAGPAMGDPALVTTRIGAQIHQLVARAVSDAPARLLSGSALSGRRVDPPEDFLGRYHTLVTALPAASGRPDWGEGYSGFGLARLFRRPRAPAVEAHGDRGPMIPFEAFDQVMPLDLPVAPLLRALLAGDIEMAEALGCLELAEADLALCSYVCIGRNDYGVALRDALSRLEQGQ